jgi:tetratricopeptide (TPR) repeat protein
MQPASLLTRILIPLLLIPLLATGERPLRIDLVLQAAQRDLAAGNPLGASERIATTAQNLPHRADLWELAGHYALQGGEPGQARSYFERAGSAGGLSPDGLEAMGEVAMLLGDLPAAVEAWQAAIDAGATSITLYEKLAGSHRDLEDYPAAIASLQALATLQPGDARHPYELGLLFAARQPESALAPLSLAAELDQTLRPKTQVIERSIRSARLAGDPVYTLVASGRALASLDEWELAAEAFRLAVEANPGYAEAWAFLGEARQHLGQDGLPALEEAVFLNPGSVAANTFLALYWQRKSRFDLALVYLYAANLEPENPALQAEIGNNLASLGEFESALKHYQQATELAPRDPQYWRALARYSIKYEIEVREIGLPAARQAVLLDSKAPASLDVMAQVLTLLGDPASSERFLHRTLQADPGYAPARVHLGLVYLLRGEPGQAREQFDLVQTLAPAESVEAEHARRLLEIYFP